jgi:hypothetical protein
LIHRTDHATPLYTQKLALTSPTSGGRSVSIVRSRTKATELVIIVIIIIIIIIIVIMMILLVVVVIIMMVMMQFVFIPSVNSMWTSGDNIKHKLQYRKAMKPCLLEMLKYPDRWGSAGAFICDALHIHVERTYVHTELN